MIRAAAVCLLLISACSDKKPEETAVGAAPPPAEPKELTPTRVNPATEERRTLVGGGHMQHCPTAVAGAQTTITPTATAVELTITAKDKNDEKAVKEIRADAQ